MIECNLVVYLVGCLVLYCYNAYFYDAFLTLLIPTHPINFLLETSAPGENSGIFKKTLTLVTPFKYKSEARIKLPTSEVNGA